MTTIYNAQSNELISPDFRFLFHPIFVHFSFSPNFKGCFPEICVNKEAITESLEYLYKHISFRTITFNDLVI